MHTLPFANRTTAPFREEPTVISPPARSRLEGSALAADVGSGAARSWIAPGSEPALAARVLVDLKRKVQGGDRRSPKPKISRSAEKRKRAARAATRRLKAATHSGHASATTCSPRRRPITATCR